MLFFITFAHQHTKCSVFVLFYTTNGLLEPVKLNVIISLLIIIVFVGIKQTAS